VPGLKTRKRMQPGDSTNVLIINKSVESGGGPKSVKERTGERLNKSVESGLAFVRERTNVRFKRELDIGVEDQQEC